MQQPIHLVWFKRDLRLADHAPLFDAAKRAAAQHGAVLPLYIVEPRVLGATDYAARHWRFTRDCLIELRAALAARGMPLVVRVGEVVEVLAQIHADYALTTILAHEETGNAITYARDRAVRKWAKQNGVLMVETPSGGVVRGLPNRDLWLGFWEKRMIAPAFPAPTAIRPLEGIEIGVIPDEDALDLAPDPMESIQLGGETAAHQALNSFLQVRGANYQREMSSPLTAETACSRLSAHLAYGSLSMKQVVHAARWRAEMLDKLPPDDSAGVNRRWRAALRSFTSRLYWRDHFMQKLEDEPEIEFHSFIRAFDEVRDDPAHGARTAEQFSAFTNGQTGYPFVDACMRSLTATGWINFRMRAMLVSFASHDLWVNWQSTGVLLGRLFTDYEAGIHYPQTQMQSGTTGINALRIYNPVKQGQDHDPDGTFIRRWCPELASVPTVFIHTPWRMPRYEQNAVGCVVGVDYPAPIIDHMVQFRAARFKIGQLRRDPLVRAESERVQVKHGSRMQGNWNRRPNRSTRRKPIPDSYQLELF